MISHRITNNIGIFKVKISAIDLPDGTAKPLIRSKKDQDAVLRLPHIAQVPNSTSQTLPLSYSPIGGEDEGPSPPLGRKK